MLIDECEIHSRSVDLLSAGDEANLKRNFPFISARLGNASVFHSPPPRLWNFKLATCFAVFPKRYITHETIFFLKIYYELVNRSYLFQLACSSTHEYFDYENTRDTNKQTPVIPGIPSLIKRRENLENNLLINLADVTRT